MSELVDARGRKYLTGPERERFLAVARAHPKPAVQTLARTLAMTGCRVSEALGLRACDVDLEANEVRIATLKRRRTHWRAIPVPEDLVQALELVHRVRRAQGSVAGREPAPVVHHPADREPPGGRAHAHRRHRGPAGVPAGASAQLRRRGGHRRRPAPDRRRGARSRLAHDDRDLHHRDRGGGARAREPHLDVGSDREPEA